MAGNRSPRQVLSRCQRPCPSIQDEVTSLGVATVAGDSRRGRGHRRQPSPPATHEEQPKDHVAAMAMTTDSLSGDEAARQANEGTQQMGDSSARSTPYLRGPASLPLVLLPNRRPVLRPVGRK
jgi:hypothetical protein